MKISDEEREAIIKELAERMKNIVYTTAEDKARAILSSIEKSISHDTGAEEVNIIYTVTFIINDLLEIIGGLRRKKEKKWD